MNTKLHILFLCGWYPSRVLPTNGDFIQRHAEAVNSLHQVSVLHLISDENATQNIEIASEKINGIQTFIGYIKKTSNPIIKGIRFYKAYKKIIQEVGGFDVIHLNELFPFGMFTFLQKKPFIVTEHWTDYKPPMNTKIGFIQKKLTQIIGKRASFLCPVSNELKEALINFGVMGNYKIVPNVVNTTIFKPVEKKSNSVFTIVHISNMNDEHKNVSGILRAVSKLKIPYHLKLIGGNSKQYKTISDDLNCTQNIEFIDHIPHKKVAMLLQKADVFVLFSNYENLPCVILESFACGTPVISTRVGGIHEFFPSDFGCLIEKGNEQVLTEKLIEIQQNPCNISDKMYNYAVTQFSNNSIANQFSNLYLKLA